MEKDQIKTLANLYAYWEEQGIERTHCIKEMLQDYGPESTTLDENFCQGDLQEIASMHPAETQAFFAMAYSFNALWSLTSRSYDNNPDGYEDEWLDNDEWRKVYAYWARKYPNAYKAVEIWVFG